MSDLLFVVVTIALFAVLAAVGAGGGAAVNAENLVGLVLAVVADRVPGGRPALPGAFLMSSHCGRRRLHRVAGRRACAGLPAVRRLHVPGAAPDAALPRSSGCIYRLIGVNPDGEQSWGVYARSVLAFSAVSILFLYLFQRVQDQLWLSLGLPGGRSRTRPGTRRSASSRTRTGSPTRVSPRWATWCRWPAWRCRTSSRPRSASRSSSRWCAGSPGRRPTSWATSGSTWSGSVCGSCSRSRSSARSCFIAAGMVQNLVRRHRCAPPWPVATQHITGGPVASQEVIKELGTNGGGFYNANSRPPVREPDRVDELARDLPAPADPVQPAAGVRPDGRPTTGRATRSSPSWRSWRSAASSRSTRCRSRTAAPCPPRSARPRRARRPGSACRSRPRSPRPPR